MKCCGPRFLLNGWPWFKTMCPSVKIERNSMFVSVRSFAPL
ncbi:hypothetical protein C4K10_1906 [Pseudomonas chlororaphis subsp. aureofaciens]|nr:hypothetical protein C4K10_1906 [Pseudomonas chlororaphis subsp. aureofaciens]